MVNTTPKPSATKKSKGELVGPPPEEPPDAEVVVPKAVAAVGVLVDMTIDTVRKDFVRTVRVKNQ